MTIEPIYSQRVWSEDAGAYSPSGEITGYQAIEAKSGAVLGTGETFADAVEDALRNRWAEYVQKSRDCAD